MTRKLTVLAFMCFGTPLLLAACSAAPHKDVAQQADVAGIGPRPAFFGRHAWEEQQAAARAKAAGPAAPVAPAAPPSPVVAMAAPPPPPPPVMAPPPPPAPQIAATPPPVPTPVQPVLPPEPQPAPVVQTAAAEPVPVAKPVKPAKAPKPPKAAKAPQDAKPFRLPFGLTPIQAPPPPPPVVGGYVDAPNKAAVDAAAAFAVHESPGYELKGVYSAKTQVVAGTNYSLCLWVRQVKHEANPLKRRLVAAKVFQGLDRHYELTEWHEVADCHAGT